MEIRIRRDNDIEVWVRFNSMTLDKFLCGKDCMHIGFNDDTGFATRVYYDKEAKRVVWEYLM